MNMAINSSRGRCIEAFISLTLHSCHLADRNQGDHDEVWNHYRPRFDVELARTGVGSYEFATLVARYIPHMMYMSKAWFTGHLGEIFDQSNYQKWLCAVQGYAYVNSIYEEMYLYLKEKEDFRRALEEKNFQSGVKDKIVENIAVAYLNNLESLDNENNLMDFLIGRQQYSELGHLIWFIWSLGKDADDKFRSKVFELWRRLIVLVKNNTEVGRKLGAKLCDWIVFVTEVNDSNRDLLFAVVACADETHSSYEMLPGIAKISSLQPLEAYELWRRLLETTYPDYPDEAIREALSNLVRANQEGLRNAKNIVGRYLERGNEEPLKMLTQITTPQ
jgi:hypothetical protein